MDITTKGIVLHKVKYGETSLIVKIFTEELGLQSFMVKGVSGKSSKMKPSYFQSMSLLELVMHLKPNQNLHQLRDVRMAHSWHHIPFSVEKQSILMFLNEVVYKTIRQEHPDKELFHWIYHTLIWFDLEEKLFLNFHLFFLIQFSRFLGFFPKGAQEMNHLYFDMQEGIFVEHKPFHPYYLDGETTADFRRLILTGLENIEELKLNNIRRRKILDTLTTFYQLHLPELGRIKSLDVLRMMSS
ncbi:MAG: DNA repair protein RecO [Bacteroidales bacterium]|nr:DNA repair protein RecO [Bacteroidales bacterium]